MAWSVLQSVSGTSGVGTTSTSATFTTANLSSGTKLIAYTVTTNGSGTGTFATVKDGAGNSFTQVVSNLVSGLNVQQVWVLDTPSGDVGTKPTITATTSGGSVGNQGALLVQEVSGLIAGTSPLDGTAGTVTGTGGTSTGSPTYSSTAANEYLISFYGDDGGGGGATITQPSGYTLDGSTINTNNPGDLGVAYTNSSNGAESGGWTRTNTGAQWGVILVAFKLAAAGAAPSGTMQPRATVPVPRRRPGRAAWRGQAVPGVYGLAPAQQFLLAARRKPVRAFVQFIPVRTVNAAPPPPVSGTVQPLAARPAPRRVPARAYVRFTPVTTVNAPPPAGGPPAFVPDAESRLIRRYRHTLRRHGLADDPPEMSMLAAPVAVAVPPGWPGTWPVQPEVSPGQDPGPSLPPAPLPAPTLPPVLASLTRHGWPGVWPDSLPGPESVPPPPPKWRPVYTRPPRVVRARHVPRGAMMPVWQRDGGRGR